MITLTYKGHDFVAKGRTTTSRTATFQDTTSMFKHLAEASFNYDELSDFTVDGQPWDNEWMFKLVGPFRDMIADEYIYTEPEH